MSFLSQFEKKRALYCEGFLRHINFILTCINFHMETNASIDRKKFSTFTWVFKNEIEFSKCTRFLCFSHVEHKSSQISPDTLNEA